MSERLQFLPGPHEVRSGPHDCGAEQRWNLRLADGRPAVVGQLAPDLARDESIRRRYVRDVERVRNLGVPTLVSTLATGPSPDPRDPAAVAPWRLRLDPEGDPLSTWLTRAPLPVDEVVRVFSGVADAVHAVHAVGAVLRDLRPEQIVCTADGRFVLTDVGLARVDVLSSHTASSLLLQGSHYAAPEQLLATIVDQRSDVYGLGVMLWQALTGELPFGDGPALLAQRHALPSLQTLRNDIPPVLDAVVHACLREQPSQRLSSVSELIWVLRGGAGTGSGEPQTTVCQHCAARLWLGQRLCLGCGRVAVKFLHATPDEPSYALELVALREDAKPLQWLQELLRTISNHPMSEPEFVIGSIHDYSEEERLQRIKLPARLYSDLNRDTAMELRDMMHAQGLRTRVSLPGDARRAGVLTAAAVGITVIASFLSYLVGLHPAWLAVPGSVVVFALMIRLMNRLSERRTLGRFQLRPAAAALPASDPLVSRLAVLLDDDPPSDVRQIVAELALLVQRLVDHRASFADTLELDARTAPIQSLVEAVQQHVRQLSTLSAELASLDEGAMVRAIAAADARGASRAERESILLGLDRLRSLEDQRAAIFHRLLEVKALLHRTVNLGLSVHDPAQEHDRQVQLALATLATHSG